MHLLDFIRCGVVSNLTNASAKVANPANPINDDRAIKAPAHLGLATLAGLAVATPLRDSNAQWQVFEALLAIVAPAYNTPAHEVEWAREAAWGDLEAVLVSYREMAAQVPHMRRRRP